MSSNFPPGVSGSEYAIAGPSKEQEEYIEANWPKDIPAFLTKHIGPNQEDWPESEDDRDDEIYNILADQYEDYWNSVDEDYEKRYDGDDLD